jgi:hypothetical protein
VTDGSKTDANAPWPWPDSMDARTAAPEFHRLLFENERVRVLEVRIRPGEFVPVHTHRCPGAVYVVSAGDFVRRDGGGKLMLDSRSASVSQPAPFVQWTGPLPPHSVENIGTTDIVLITTELKS